MPKYAEVAKVVSCIHLITAVNGEPCCLGLYFCRVEIVKWRGAFLDVCYSGKPALPDTRCDHEAGGDSGDSADTIIFSLSSTIRDDALLHHVRGLDKEQRRALQSNIKRKS